MIGAWILISVPLSLLIGRIIRRGEGGSEKESTGRGSESHDIDNRAA